MAKGKRTFQPNNRRRAKVHGFRLRSRTRAGRAILSARRRKGRAEIAV
ncbi:50S ribosomal protein L34 [Smaragdicoccus niigatensis]|nr:50S ribosomal protein L34 [Smaragdicoccus niigatensis]